MVTVKTPEEYIRGFPHKTLPRIDGEPTYASIRLLQKKLAANAATIKTTLGGGAHGYLALCLTPAAYATHSLTAFVPPINPGNAPIFPIRATSAAIAGIKATHDENLRRWEEYNAVMQALKNQLTAAVDEVYLKAIADPVTEYTNLNLMAMLHHLYDTYGKITEERLEKNRNEMTASYDVTLPIDSLFNRIEECSDFADAARSPFTQAQILSSAFLIIQKTGIFNKECRKWRKKDPHHKTWANFKVHFREAYDDYKEDLQMNTAGSAFNANAQEYTETAPMFQDSFEHLAAATAADRTAVANLTAANAKLSQELQSKNTNYTTLQRSMEKLQQQLAALQTSHQQPSQNNTNMQPQFQPPSMQFMPYHDAQQSYYGFFRPPGRGRRGRGRSRGRGRGWQAPAQQQFYQPQMQNQQNSSTFSTPQQTQVVPQQQQFQSYCWTHGVTNNPSHTSQTCRNPAQGHQQNATVTNMMGGNTFGLPY